MQEEEKFSATWNEEDLQPSEPAGFSPDELVSCESCRRTNPPTRSNCLYCGIVLPTTDVTSRTATLALRPLEDWEQGFNAIITGAKRECSPHEVKNVAESLRLDGEDLQRILSSGARLPLVRCATRDDALAIENLIADLGLSVLVVADSELDSCQPKRVRSLEMTDESIEIHAIGSADIETISWKDISLIVTGRRIVRRLEVAERTGKRKSKEIVSSRELNSDAERLDFYGSQDGTGWRITEDNFDFSCLGESKTLVASKNFQTLKEVLRGRAHSADFDDSYMRVRQLLSVVWPLAQQTESLGLRKPRSGRINTAAVTTSDNDSQFTRYSRLLHHLKLHYPEKTA